MPRIPEVPIEQASPAVQELYKSAEARIGMVPNVFRAMAHSPAVLSSFLEMDRALQAGVLGRRFQQQVAVAVAQYDRSPYCLAVNTAIGLHVGLSPEELREARQLHSTDEKEKEGLRFVHAVLDRRGRIDDADFDRVRAAGFDDREIAELMGNLAFNLFANYFNLVAGSTVDFPEVALD